MTISATLTESIGSAPMIATPPVKPPVELTQAAVVDSLESTFSTLTEREILIKLYEKTDGENWNDASNWCSDVPLSRWFGVKINDLGQVITLRLCGNYLSGEIPPELSQLKNLQRLNLCCNTLIGRIPEELGQLKSLSYLYLDYNKLTESIPPELGQLENLNHLHLDSNYLRGVIPEELSKLKNLTSLQIQNNNLSGELPDFVKDIKHTCLGDNNFTN